MIETIPEAGWVPERILAAYLLAHQWVAPTSASPYWKSLTGFRLTLPQAVVHQIHLDYGDPWADEEGNKA